ncbi:hypothetical protein BJY04DRAFT_224298 [Aspergillus karnatakaensis]|uniref:uncharacterized protein n=1 Tax=Aspergillus karnatakaensis TaxID=1810916 RepID=UPI003CCD6DB6
MVQTRCELKRKAVEALVRFELKEKRSASASTSASVEDPILLPLPDFTKRLQALVNFRRDGGGDWPHGVSQLTVQSLRTAILSWANRYVISDIDQLAPDRIRALIAEANGFCVQIEWEELRSQLAPNAAGRFGIVLGELLLYLAVNAYFFQNPFWYMDGKKGPDDSDGDPSFSRKFNYLYERFLEGDEAFAILWKSQTQRLLNPTGRRPNANPTIRTQHEKLRNAALPGFADRFLTSEPLCWLLKDLTDTPELITKRRTALIDTFHKADKLMIACETFANGQPVLRGIEELRGIYNGDSKCIALSNYGWHKHWNLYNGQRVLVVVRPGLVGGDAC